MTITYSLKRKRSQPTSPPSSPPSTISPSRTLLNTSGSQFLLPTPEPQVQHKPARQPLSSQGNAKLPFQPISRPTKIQRTDVQVIQPTIPADTAPTNNAKDKDNAAGGGSVKKMTQMTIDLGGPAQKTCKICGMSYITSHADDRALHEKFHDAYTNGTIAPPGLLKDTAAVCAKNSPISVTSVVCRGAKKGKRKEPTADDVVVKVTRESGRAAKGVVQQVLSRAETDLGSVPLAPEDLWSLVTIPERVLKPLEAPKRSMHEVLLPTPPTSSPGPSSPEEASESSSARSETGEDKKVEVPRFEAYVYVHETRIVGVCLAERVHSAHWTLPEALDGESQQDLEPLDHPAEVAQGIARIWVLPNARLNHVAKRLLDAVASSLVDPRRCKKRNLRDVEWAARGAFEEAKARVAFSQLTALGEGLARCWTRQLWRGPEAETTLVYDSRGVYA